MQNQSNCEITFDTQLKTALSYLRTEQVKTIPYPTAHTPPPGFQDTSKPVFAQEFRSFFSDWVVRRGACALLLIGEDTAIINPVLVCEFSTWRIKTIGFIALRTDPEFRQQNGKLSIFTFRYILFCSINRQ